MKATMKNLNAAIAARWPNLDIELVKGDGYFYFDGDDGFDKIESMYTFALNGMDFDKWMEHIGWKIEAVYLPNMKGEMK